MPASEYAPRDSLDGLDSDGNRNYRGARVNTINSHRDDFTQSRAPGDLRPDSQLSGGELICDINWQRYVQVPIQDVLLLTTKCGIRTLRRVSRAATTGNRGIARIGGARPS